MGGPGENYAGPPFDGCHRTSLAESRANVDDWPGELHRKLGLAATAGPGSAPIERSALQEAQLRMAWSAGSRARRPGHSRSEEHTSELQSRQYLVCRLLLEKKKR